MGEQSSMPVYRQLIYVCGGFTTLCEVFDTNLRTYTPLLFELDACDSTVSFFYNNELVSIVRNKAYFNKDIRVKSCKLDPTL